jgi:hypothetical protein
VDAAPVFGAVTLPFVRHGGYHLNLAGRGKAEWQIGPFMPASTGLSS